ncbi:MAG: sterol desaturase family protein [Halofilum sp. (in: g-proteobacteria)]|nr:sterol desaturase family protein [Halofilum sp. (in: g-proteobacteria)]
MLEGLLSQEIWVRLGAFLGVLALMTTLETIWPCRPRTWLRSQRWPANLAMIAVDSAVVRALFPTAAVGIAWWAQEQGLGLFPWLGVPGWLALVASVLLLDLTIYLQHVAFHYIPPLWRLHRMHHSDVDVDVTTAGRFHPLEIVISMALKAVVVIALGAPAAAVLIFEVLLNATSVFNHANLHLPSALDRVLRWIVVTPDMHRIHHSVIPRETNSNFGFNLPWWDRLFRTYRRLPEKGYDGMTTGLETFRHVEDNRLLALLVQPFKAPPVENRPNRTRRAD